MVLSCRGRTAEVGVAVDYSTVMLCARSQGLAAGSTAYDEILPKSPYAQ